MSKGGNKAVFLDRDGTVNVEKHYLFRKEDFEYIDGAVDGLRKLSDAGFLLVVVTNQSGIARGFYKESDFLALDEWMKSDLAIKGITIAGSYYCPHLPDAPIQKYSLECGCRKPGTELFWKAQKELFIDMDRSFAVGDKERDLSICRESGVRGILLSETGEKPTDTMVCRNWEEIVKTILAADARESNWAD